MYKILITDDEDRIREVLREYALSEGYEVVEASNGYEAVSLCKIHDFDMVILDIMMPVLDGFSACKEIKAIKNMPVLMLSARGEEYDKLTGFELGIDDYVVKPFSPREVMARLKAILGRNHIEETDKNKLVFDGLIIDAIAMNVFVDNVKIELTPKQYALLIYMVENKNIALARDKLLDGVWGIDFYGDYRTVDTHIKMLRNSLGKYKSFIITVREVGYKFEA